MHEVVELAPGMGVETGCRLVQKQQLGPPDNAYGNVHPAALAAGERRSSSPRARRGQRSRSTRPRHKDASAPASRTVRRTYPDERATPAPSTCRGRARTVTPPRREPAPSLVTPRRVHTKHPDLPGRAHPEPLQNLDGGRLASPVRPEQGQHLTPPRNELDTPQDVNRPIPHPQITYVDHHALSRVLDVARQPAQLSHHSSLLLDLSSVTNHSGSTTYHMVCKTHSPRKVCRAPGLWRDSLGGLERVPIPVSDGRQRQCVQAYMFHTPWNPAPRFRGDKLR